MIPENPSFHAHHSPIGALASFTCGAHGAQGGMGLELGEPYQGELNIGYQDGDGNLNVLPLFKGSDSKESERYVEGGESKVIKENVISDISREYLWATDRIKSPNVEFEICTPFFGIVDPESGDQSSLAFACCPAVHVKITFKNDSDSNWKGFFGLTNTDKWTPLSEVTGGDLCGAMSRNSIGFATTDPEAKSYIDFTLMNAFIRQHTNDHFLLGAAAGIMIDVPAGETKELNLALGFYKAGIATFNREMSYYYTRHFSSLIQVLEYALDNRSNYINIAAKRDKDLEEKALNDEQKFLVAHATRSYYGSTQWLWDGVKSVWVVNEGEYLMMNTFDLTVDMLFFEMMVTPWAVRNELEYFADNYSYYDEVFEPGKPEKLYPGGISFAHDMGVANHWSPKGYSSYEVGGLDRLCFSHMTCEQLTNWVLCAGVYIAQTDDQDFLRQREWVLKECFTSLLNRDNPDPAKRNGIMSFESSRTLPGGEITTYDSLDHSLGQSRNNIYLGGKMWASFVILEYIFNKVGKTHLAEQAKASAILAANTIAAGFDEELGYIPAVLEGDSKSTIIPAIEALVYPYEMGIKEASDEKGPYGNYIKTLKKHVKTVMTTDLCLYEDGGWKLSSSADNSWMSKICLSQYVARQILGFDFGEDQFKADQAHARWEREGSKLQACSDQFKSGEAKGSLYYPRIVTNILWLKEDK